MAKPMVFISSTFYDMKHIRSSLESFIESLGFQPILSEKGNIAYAPDIPLDESCYREVQNSDIFVLIVGGRYGSAVSLEQKDLPAQFYERYKSITKHEYETAAEKDVPTYILIDKSVYTEYETFKKNRNNTSINYAHVDSINIFHLIDEILGKKKNNPVHQFERHAEIEFWLREQWAGLFKEMLSRQSEIRQIASLSDQVVELSNINITMKRYLEEVITKVVEHKKASTIIEDEGKRLIEARKLQEFLKHPFVKPMLEFDKLSADAVKKVWTEADSFEDFAKRLQELGGAKNYDANMLLSIWRKEEKITKGINEVRSILGLNEFKWKQSIATGQQRQGRASKKKGPTLE